MTSNPFNSPRDPFNRLLPNNIEAEMALLGSLAMQPDHLAQIAGMVRREDFFLIDHQIIFDALVTLWHKGQAVDSVILRAYLEQHDQLMEIGGTAYIAEILSSVGTAAHLKHYAGVVRDKSLLRKIVSAAQQAIDDVHSPHDRAEDIFVRATARFSEISTGTSDSDSIHVAEAMRLGVGKPDEARDYVTTGFPSLDRRLGGGFDRGEHVILAARTSMGKTTLARQIAMAAAAANFPTLYISLEERRALFGRKATVMESGVENQRIRSGSIAEEEWEQIVDAMKRVESVPYFFNDKARRLDDIRMLVAKHVARDGLRLVVIDYMGLIQGPTSEDGYTRMSVISRELASIPKEFGIVAINMHQINRAVENREDKRPAMSMLRDSGQIEQDADTILLLHREDYYYLEDEHYEPTGVAELILAKVRDGERGVIVDLKSDLKHQRFFDLNI